MVVMLVLSVMPVLLVSASVDTPLMPATFTAPEPAVTVKVFAPVTAPPNVTVLLAALVSMVVLPPSVMACELFPMLTTVPAPVKVPAKVMLLGAVAVKPPL